MIGLSITLSLIAACVTTGSTFLWIGLGVWLLFSAVMTALSNDQGPFKVQVWNKGA